MRFVLEVTFSSLPPSFSTSVGFFDSLSLFKNGMQPSVAPSAATLSDFLATAKDLRERAFGLFAHPTPRPPSESRLADNASRTWSAPPAARANAVPKDADYKTLVALLREAARLELALMCSYLFTACSIKQLPAEFGDHPRRAAQFEQARQLKTSILRIAVEEMVHLHYVNCLLRGLGERREFRMPPHEDGAFQFQDWEPIVNGDCTPLPTVPIRIVKCTAAQLRHFVLFESTDALQDVSRQQLEHDADTIYRWEMMLPCAQMTQCTTIVPGAPIAALTPPDKAMTGMLYQLFTGAVAADHATVPAPPPCVSSRVHDTSSTAPAHDASDAPPPPPPAERVNEPKADTANVRVPPPPPADRVHELTETAKAPNVPPAPLPQTAFIFRSVADLYNKILTLYDKAHANGWMVQNNKDFANEINYESDNGFLPFPLLANRGGRFNQMDEKNAQDLMHYASMIKEIVEEGEGHGDFVDQLAAFLAAYPPTFEGICQFSSGKAAAQKKTMCPVKTPSEVPNPDDVAVLRSAHLYGFLRGYGFLRNELSLDAKFCLFRQPIITNQTTTPPRQSGNAQPPPTTSAAAGAPSSGVLQTLHDGIAQNFNVVFLCVTTWLGRMYDTEHWFEDRSRRHAIENLATFPLMSMGIRPLLELCGLFGDDVARLLFRIGRNDHPRDFLPHSNPFAAALWLKAHITDHSESDHVQMDRLSLAALSDVATWIRSIGEGVKQLPPGTLSQAIMDVIEAAVVNAGSISELATQFPWVATGALGNFPPPPGADLPKEAGDIAEMTAYSEDVARYASGGGGPPQAQQGPILQQQATAGGPPGSPGSPILRKTAVLRLRFQGSVGVCHATDPDPSADVQGISGNVFLRAADVTPSFRHLQRAIDFQATTSTVNRELGPTTDPDSHPLTPRIGVKVTDATVLMADSATVSAPITGVLGDSTYPKPYQLVRAVQLSEMGTVASVRNLVTAHPTTRVHLETVDGVRPEFFGRNGLVVSQGEPIDPFQLALTTDGDDLATRTLRRSVLGPPGAMTAMPAWQRGYTGRFPLGYALAPNGFTAGLSPWAMTHLDEPWKTNLAAAATNPRAIFSFADQTMAQRTPVMFREMQALCAGNVLPSDTPSCDKLVTLACRLGQFVPKFCGGGIASIWLSITTFFGHTISGALSTGEGAATANAVGDPAGSVATAGHSQDPTAGPTSSRPAEPQTKSTLPSLFSAFAADGGFNLDVTAPPSGLGSDKHPNASWLIRYALGGMDQDALRFYANGELFIPVTVTPVAFSPVPPFEWLPHLGLLFQRIQESLSNMPPLPTTVVRLHRQWRVPAVIPLEAVRSFLLTWQPWWATATTITADTRFFANVPTWSCDPEPVGVFEKLLFHDDASTMYGADNTQPESPTTPKEIGFHSRRGLLSVERVPLPSSSSPPPSSPSPAPSAKSDDFTTVIFYAAAFIPTSESGALTGMLMVTQFMQLVEGILAQTFQAAPL